MNAPDVIVIQRQAHHYVAFAANFGPKEFVCTFRLNSPLLLEAGQQIKEIQL